MELTYFATNNGIYEKTTSISTGTNTLTYVTGGAQAGGLTPWCQNFI